MCAMRHVSGWALLWCCCTRGVRTSSAVMSSQTKITGHRISASQLSAAVSTGYTQHTISHLRRDVYTGVCEYTGDCFAKDVIHIQHPWLLNTNLTREVLTCLFSISRFKISLFILFGNYRKIGEHLNWSIFKKYRHCNRRIFYLYIENSWKTERRWKIYCEIVYIYFITRSDISSIFFSSGNRLIFLFSLKIFKITFLLKHIVIYKIHFFCRNFDFKVLLFLKYKYFFQN